MIGCGYLGAVHAACMAELGHDVLGVETDPQRLARLRRGEAPFFEPGLEELLKTHVASGALRFTDSAAEAAAFADLHFLCVGTPQREGSLAADLSQMESAVQALAPHLDRPALVVGKSTVPVGTAAALQAELRATAPAGQAVELAWNPEFLREGFAVGDTLRPDRIVIGADSPSAEVTLCELYAKPLADGTPLVVTDFPTAELVKVAANSFLATKISFINAMAEVCEAADADVVSLADAIGHDVRIGRAFLNAGLGFGGGCLPKDIRAFLHRAGELGVEDAMAFLREVDSINLRQRHRVVERATTVLGEVSGARVAVLGAAFKPNSDDIRDSPALWVAGQLHLAGAMVSVYDPQAMGTASQKYPTLTYAPTALDACDGADLVLHLTEWREFRRLDPAEVGARVRQRRIIDARNALDAQLWTEAGWDYSGIGRGAPGSHTAAGPVNHESSAMTGGA